MKKQELLKFISWTETRKKWMKDPEFRKGFEAIRPERVLLEAIIKQRIKKGLTQKQLAEKMGKKQSAIARFESGRYSPTLGATREVMDKLGLKFVIKEK